MSTASRDVWLVSQVVVLQDLVSCFGWCSYVHVYICILVVCMCLVLRHLGSPTQVCVGRCVRRSVATWATIQSAWSLTQQASSLQGSTPSDPEPLYLVPRWALSFGSLRSVSRAFLLDLSVVALPFGLCSIQDTLTTIQYDYYTNHHRGIRLLCYAYSYYSLSPSRILSHHLTTHFNKR